MRLRGSRFFGWLLVVVSLSGGGLAQEVDFKPTGIPGGIVHRLAVDPETSTTAYAGTNGGGVFKTTAGGAAWKEIREGLDGERGAVEALAVSPSDPERLFVAFRSRTLYRSENGGAAWERVGEDAFSDAIRDLAVAGDGTVYAASDCVVRSTDSGSTWIPHPDTCSDATALAVDPNDASVVYAASAVGLLLTRDGGETWERGGVPDGPIRTLAVDPRSSENLYASGFDAVYRSTDGGRSFVKALAGRREVFYDAIVDAGGTGTIYAASHRRLLQSVDGGESWTVWGELPPQPPRRLAQADGSFLLATQCGIFRTGEGGTPWAAASGNLLATEIRALASDDSLPGFLFAGTDKCGRYRSVDGGVSWSRLQGPRSSTRTFDLAIDPAAPRRIFAVTGGGLFRSLDRGITWSGPDRGLAGPGAPGGADLNLVRLARDASGAVYVVLKGVLYRSDDRGTTWLRLDLDAVSGTPLGVSWITLDPTDGGAVYAVKGTSLLVTFDGSLTWRRLAEDLGGPLLVDPSAPQTLYARSPKEGGWEVSKSVDGGETWTVSSAGLEKSVETLEIDPRDPSTLYASAETSGFYVSHDGAATWQPLGSSAASARVLEATGPSLYAGTRRGVLALPQVCGDELIPTSDHIFIAGVESRTHRSDVTLDAAGRAFFAYQAPNRGAAFSALDLDNNRLPRFFLVRIGGSYRDRGPAVASDGPGEVLVAWRRDFLSDRQFIRVQRYGILGETLGETQEIHHGRRRQDPFFFRFEFATLDLARSRSGDAVVVFEGIAEDDRAFLQAQRLAPTGSPLGEAISVREGAERIMTPAVGMDAFGRFTVAWLEAEEGGPLRARLRAFRHDGQPRRDPVTLGTPLLMDPPVAERDYPVAAPAIAVAPTGEAVVAWLEENARIEVRWFDPAGNEVGQHSLPTDGCCAYLFDLAVDGFGHTLFVWRGDGPDILARVYDMQGRPTSPETVVVGEFGPRKRSLAAAFDLSGRAVIAWRKSGGGQTLIRRYTLGCAAGAAAAR